MLSMYEIHDPAIARGYYYDATRRGMVHPSGAFVPNARMIELADVESLATLLDREVVDAEHRRWNLHFERAFGASFADVIGTDNTYHVEAGPGDVIFTASPPPALTVDPLAAAYRDIQDRGAAVRGGLALLSSELDRIRPQVRALIEADRAARRARWWLVAKVVGAVAVAAACAWAALL